MVTPRFLMQTLSVGKNTNWSMSLHTMAHITVFVGMNSIEKVIILETLK